MKKEYNIYKSIVLLIIGGLITYTFPRIGDYFVPRATKNINIGKINDTVIFRTFSKPTIKYKYLNNHFILDGKKITNNKVLEEINKREEAIITLADSIDYFKQKNTVLYSIHKKYKDSTLIYKSILKLIKKNYDISYSFYEKGNQYISSINAPKLDSALILFPIYKNKISIKDNKWVIETDRDYRREQRKLKNK